MKLRALLLSAALVGGLAACGSDLDPACEAPSGQRCAGNTVVTCVGEQVTKRDCAAEQLECGYVDTATGFSCVADACAFVGPLGRCVGSTLTRCTAGRLTDTTCGDGQACAYVDDVTGYGCRAAAEPAMVAGEIRYEDRPQTGRGPLGDLRLQPVRGITVTVIDDATAQVLATVTTADNGSYVARFAATPGAMIHVTAVARSVFTGRPITVVNGANLVHGFGSPSFAAAAESTLDLVITNASAEAEAFNVFDQAVSAMDALTGKVGIAAPAALRLRWVRGSQDGTYYGGGTVHLLGAADDDDGYDDTVILHEIGHHVEATVGRSDSPGGGHNGTPTDPRLAWSEGYATYWAQSVAGQPIYSDSNSGGGFYENIDTEVRRANGTGMSQPMSESTVSEILWDLGDAVLPDDDLQTSTTHADVNKVQPGYLRVTALRNVGVAGVDLVDFLDGWFKLQGLSSCVAVKDIVTVKRNFPYDYAGPGGACP